MYEYQTVILFSHDGKELGQGVIKIFTNENMIIMLTSTLSLKVNEIITIKICDKVQGCKIYKGYVKSINKNILNMGNLFLDKIKQRRKSRRILIRKNADIDKIICNSNDVINLKKKIFMTAKDISKSGILLESPLDIPDKVHFLISLPIDDNFIHLKTTTVRKYQKNDLFYYGCTFTIDNQFEYHILTNFIDKNYINQIKNQSPKIPIYYNRINFLKL